MRNSFTTGFFACAALTASSVAFAGTPYDLIRPTWPLTWDEKVFDNYDVSVTKNKDVLPKKLTPEAFEPNEFIPDTLDQAYLDAINYKVSPIRVNQAGYLESDAERQFYYVASEDDYEEDEEGLVTPIATFEIVDAEGKSLKPAVKGTFASSGQQIQSDMKVVAGTNASTYDQMRYQLNIKGQSGLVFIGKIPQGVPTSTRLRVKVGKNISSTFIVSDDVYSMVRDAGLKFFGVNRSGNSESWIHGPSHLKDGAGPIVTDAEDVRGGYNEALAGTLQGGWYDCGDYLKESQTQMYALMVTSLLAAANPDKDDDHYAYNHNETENVDGIPDILREAKHGADFVLRSFVRAKGVIDDMALSVGNFGSDHGGWGLPEYLDFMPVDNSATATDRGGPAARTVRLGEIGSNIGGETVAALALLSKTFAPYDKPFADSCLMVAEKMYDFAKNLQLGEDSYDGGKTYVNNTKAAGWSSPAYNGNNEAYDDLALAAIALHYATYEKTGKMDYFNDAVEETSFGDQSSYVGNGYFNGGWMAYTRDGMYKSLKNTSWANAHTYALYAFYKLLLKDDATALKYGISTESKKSESKETRLWYAENVGLALGGNLSYFSYYGAASEGTISIQAGGLGGASITYDALWYSLMTDQDWIYNRYQAGNIFEVLAYAEVTADLENIELPQAQTVRSWQSAKMKQLAINQLNYMFGVNPWDLSFMAGVGDKNDAHPHHRMNPEGQNMMAGVQYKYRPIVGAIYGGMRPGAKNSIEPQSKSWEDYRLTETCVDGSATLLGALQILSKSTDKTLAPTKSDVNVITIDKDNVLIEVKQDVAGPATIYYGTTESKKMETAATDETSKKSHYITLNDLKSSTEYSFYVVVANGTSGKKLEKYKDSKKTAFTFKTTKEAREKAVITDVGVLNITGDSTDVVWKTTNGKFASKVYWDTLDVAADKMQWNTGDGNADRSGILTEEHLVRIGGLRVNKTYYYAVESDGVIVKTDADKKSLKFTTAVPTRMDLSGYMYDYGGLDNMHIEIANGESFDLDNLTLRMYFTAKPEEVEECATMIDADICRNYDVAGFSGRCKNDLELRDLLRSAKPVKLEKTLNEKEGSYTWYYPIPLGSTTISAYSKIWIDLSISSGVPGADGCKPLRSAAAKKFSAKSNDWSFMPHRIASGDPADYDGMLLEEKDYGDYASHLNTNPYIVVTQGDLVIWGYGPTEAERPTLAPDKRYVLDFTGATMYKTSSKLQVYVPNSGAKTVALFNMRGAKVLQETFNGNNHDVDLSRLPRGNYVARLISQRKVIMTRQFGIQ